MSNKPRRKKKTKVVPIERTIPEAALAPPEANPDPVIVQRLKRLPDVDVVVTNTEPEALLFITPILRKMKEEYGSRSTLHVTKPSNPSFLSLVEGLDTVHGITVHNKIDENTISSIEKKSGNVIMFNFLAALQQTLVRGFHAPQGIAALTQIVLNQIECLNLEVSLDQAAADAAKTVYGEDYYVIAPEFIAAIDPQYTAQRIWDRNKWLEIIEYINEKTGEDVIVLSFKNGFDALLPEGRYDGAISIMADTAEEAAAIIVNAKMVLGIDAGFVQIARAFSKPIIHIHSGGPVSWSGSIYPPGDPRNGTTRIVAAIDINVIEANDVKGAFDELLEELAAHENVEETKEVRSDSEAEISTEGTETETCDVGEGGT